MKLLLIYADTFAYQTRTQTLESSDEVAESARFEKVQTAFIHVEKDDEERQSYVETKLVKNLKWAARKNGTTRILLHSFAHLAESKADPTITKHIFDQAEERLTSAGYNVSQTPFGFFLDLDMQAPGLSLARIFKSI